MIKFGIIGVGAIGTIIAVHLERSGAYICAGVHTRSRASCERFQSYIHAEHLSLKNLVAKVETLFVTTQDDAIGEIAAQLSRQMQAASLPPRLVVHCSGSLPAVAMYTREGFCRSVSIHPYRAFTTIESGLGQLPGTHFGVDGSDEEAVRAGEALVKALGGVAHPIPSAAKTLYHAAAVIASNYLVTLAAISTDLLTGIGLDTRQSLDLLLPLMKGTLENIHQAGDPVDALTGPVARGDIGVVRRQVKELPSSLCGIFRALGEETLAVACRKRQRTGQTYPEGVEEELLALFRTDIASQTSSVQIREPGA